MENGYSLADLAAVNGDGLGGNNIVTLLLLFALISGNGLFGNNGRNYFGEYATSASQNEILSGQKFDAVQRSINQVGDGLCSSTYALNNSILGEGRAIQTQLAECCCANQRNTDAIRYDMATQIANTNATITASNQKVLDALAQSKIDSLQSQLSTVQNQLALQTAMCGVPKINPYMYGIVPTYNGCNCGSI